MPESLPKLTHDFLLSLQRENASPHTIRNYRTDLEEFVAAMPAGTLLDAIDAVVLRSWLAGLYQRNLNPLSMRRKLLRSDPSIVVAAGRSCGQQHCQADEDAAGAEASSPVMTQEQAVSLMEGAVPSAASKRP
ncbi:MAG: site-specific integrase [Bryobacteraceae bacterium]